MNIVGYETPLAAAWIEAGRQHGYQLTDPNGAIQTGKNKVRLG